ncbi:MAG: hypothetical protein JXP48_13905 [Acidobacteria bacterium]|nr:hypothetical protein [Acidobacteriota bacterium]
MLKRAGEDACRAVAAGATAPAPHISLLLAGGDGTRLRDLTREVAGRPIPKQYCRLLRGSSLLEATLARARRFSTRANIRVVVNRDHLELAREQLRDLPEDSIFIQPHNLDTGPGLLFSLLQIERATPDAVVAAFPTDHYVEDDGAFIRHVRRAAAAIARMPDRIAILGAAPDRPETGYGYILPAGAAGMGDGIFNVEAFTEKPDLPAAGALIARGGLWNTFVMVFRLSRMMDLLARFAPEGFGPMLALRDAPEKAADIYASIRAWNFSTHFLARIPRHLLMVEVTGVGWSDWGTRESIERTYRTLNLVPFWNQARAVSHQAAG